jgi:hypothetical protein
MATVQRLSFDEAREMLNRAYTAFDDIEQSILACVKSMDEVAPQIGSDRLTQTLGSAREASSEMSKTFADLRVCTDELKRQYDHMNETANG